MSRILLLAALAVPAWAQVQVMTCGTPVDTVISPPAFTNLAFNAEAGEAVWIRANSLSNDPAFAPRITLFDSFGRSLQPRSPAFLQFEFDLPADGTYRIQLSSPNQQSGNVRVMFIPLNRPCSGAALQCGAPAQNQIDAAFQAKSYQFLARAGDVLSARITKFSTPALPLASGFNVSMAAYSSLGRILPDATDPAGRKPAAVSISGQLLAVTTFLVTANGPVTIVVYDPANLSGNFAVSVSRLNGPCGNSVLGCGGVERSSIEAPVQVNTYSVNLNTGDKITLRMAKTDPGRTLLPTMEVYDPDGVLVLVVRGSPVAIGTFTAVKTGSYNVFAEDGSTGIGAVGAGPYAIALTRLNRPCEASQISCGSVVDGSIDSLLQSKVYMLDAGANDVFLLRLLRRGPAGPFRPRVDVYDPQGNLQQFLNTDDLGRLSFTTPSTGRYTVLVSDSFDSTQTGAYTLSLLQLNRPCGAGALTCGEAAAGSLARPLEAAVYSYTAAAGDSFSVRMLDSSGGSLQPSIEIYDPQGNPAGQSAGGAFAQTDVAKPEGGTYTIVAQSANRTGATGQFAIDLLRTRNACGAVTPPQGSTVTGAATGQAPFVAYSVPVASGDSLLVRSASNTPGFSPQMELYDPDGSRVDAATFGISRKLTAAGNYTLIVGPAAPKTAGAFSLSWQLLNKPANVTSLQCGGSATASISSANQFRYYSVAADSGDLMRLIFTKLSDTFSPQLELYSPAGIRLAANSDMSQRAADGGTYLALVGPSSSNTETGAFTLAYQRPNNPCTPVKLTCGQTTLRQASIPGQVDTFSFDGTAGEQANLRLTPRSGAYAPFVELYDSKGTRLGSTSAGLLRQLLPADGIYTLLVRDRNAVNLGSYRVALQNDSNTCAVDDKETPAVTLLRPTGGEVLAGGTIFRIQWLSDDNTGVTSHDVALSTDGGRTFSAPIAGGLGGSVQSYDWSLPSDIAPSRTAVIRVSAADAAGNVQAAASDLLSLIGSGFTANSGVSFTYDALNRVTQAVLGDGRTIQYTWDASGNLVQVTVSGQ